MSIGTNVTIKPAGQADMDHILADLHAYDEWHPDLKGFQEQVTAEGFSSPYGRDDASLSKRVSHQLVNFLAHHQGLAFTRAQLLAVESVMVGDKPTLKRSGDVIQTVNKMNQQGLKQFNGPVDGQFRYGLTGIALDLSKVAARRDSTTGKRRSVSEANGRAMYREMATGPFEKGHRNPDEPLTDENCVMQPRYINRTFKNTYKFDHRGLPLVPTAEHLTGNMGTFFSKAEWARIREAIDAHLGASD